MPARQRSLELDLATTVRLKLLAHPITEIENMQVFKVQGMTCGHCVKAVTQAIQAADGQAQVQVELALGEVRVQSSLSPEAIRQAISEEGYSVA